MTDSSDAASSNEFDVVIVGGGIVGTAIAWRLLERDPKLRVALVEKTDIGAGSTSRSAAAFRHQFSSLGNILLSRRSYEIYKDFDERFETGARTFHENGYLLLYTDAEKFRLATERAKRQQELGVPVQILDPAGIDALPGLSGFFALDELVGATFCARDGFLDPLLVAQTFYRAARDKGLTMVKQECTGFLRDGERVVGVKTGAGELKAGHVVNAMGWLSNKVLDEEGLSVPFMPVKRYLYVTTPVRDQEVKHLPMIVRDLEPYMRPEAGNALLMGWDALPRVPSPESMDAEHDYDALEAAQDQVDPEFTNDEYGLEIRVRMADVVPLLESDKLRLQQETCGYYQITSDEKPVLDEDPRAPGLIHAVGFSGHGIMHAPAAADFVAALILGGAPEGLEDVEEGTFSLAPLLAHEARPDPEHMSI